MASRPYASGSEYVGWTVLRMPYCRFGRCSGLGIGEMKLLRRERCSGDVAMGLRLRKA
jgi:hypothetical protein